MFTYTVYGVNVPERRTRSRVEPVQGISGVVPVQRSRGLQHGVADQSQKVLAAQEVAQSPAPHRFDSMLFVSVVVPRKEPRTHEVADMVIQNLQPLLLAYRQPKITEDQDIIEKHQHLLDNIIARHNSAAIVWQ